LARRADHQKPTGGRAGENSDKRGEGWHESRTYASFVMKLSGNFQRASHSGLEPSIDWLLPPLAAVFPMSEQENDGNSAAHRLF